MPDWSRLISERMGVLALSGAVRDEVVAELATHLEELYQACRARGASESQAIEIALSQATDWQELGREISDIKNEEAGMNDRSKQLLVAGLGDADGVDGLAHDASASKLESWKQLVSRKPTADGVSDWLITQPVFGAAGAYLSRRNGGTRHSAACRRNISFHCLVGLADLHNVHGILCGTKPVPLEASRILCPRGFSLGNLSGDLAADWRRPVLHQKI